MGQVIDGAVHVLPIRPQWQPHRGIRRSRSCSAGGVFLNIDDVALLILPESLSEANDASITLYPNPTSDRLTVVSEAMVRCYELYNVMGMLVRRESIGAKSFQVLASAQTNPSLVINP